MERKLFKSNHQKEASANQLFDSEALNRNQEKRGFISTFKKIWLVREQIKTAQICLTNNNFQEAILLFDQVLEIDKKSKKAIRGKEQVILLLIEEGIGHLCDNEFDDAIKCFNEVLKIDNQYDDAYIGLCVTIKAKFSQIII